MNIIHPCSSDDPLYAAKTAINPEMKLLLNMINDRENIRECATYALSIVICWAATADLHFRIIHLIHPTSLNHFSRKE